MRGKDSMLRTFLFSLLVTFSFKPLAAEEVWACGGFSHSDGSTGQPFLLRGDGHTYRFTDVVPTLLEYVATNKIMNYKIFISGGGTTYRNAFYIRETGNKLLLRKNFWEFSHAEAACRRELQ